MKINVIDISSKASGTTNLSDAIFGLEPRKDILHRTVVYQLAKKRAGTHKVKNRAEIISQNQSFSKKADIYFRLKRLIDEKEMGNLFKVMFIKNKHNKYKLGFN